LRPKVYLFSSIITVTRRYEAQQDISNSFANALGLSVYIAIAPGESQRNVYGVGFNRPSRPEEVPMPIVNVLIIGALIATVVVLALGLGSMARGGTYDKEHAEKFMWERVALQLLVVILLVAAAVVFNT
jgi:hypothetical protein